MEAPFEEIEREQIAFGNTSDDDCGEHIPYKMQNDRICNGFRCHGKIGKSQAGSPHIENHEPFPLLNILNVHQCKEEGAGHRHQNF